MTPEFFRSKILGLCGFVLLVCLMSVECSDINQEISDNLLEESDPNALVVANGSNVMYWPWPSRKFRCPTAFGAYPDPDACSHFYICVAKIATRTRCPYLYRFCKVKRVCLPMLIAVCDDGSGEVTEEVSTQRVTTEKEGQFVCPEEQGQFLHPHDCSKYYDCENYQYTEKTCRGSKLFDGVKGRCRSADKVHCGSRVKPTGATPLLETTQEIITSSTDIATEAETETPTVEETTSPSTEDPSTHPVTKPRVTAPDTDCDEDDLDCIIDDLGLTPGWFVCPDAVGSYPHPTSTKLFIFCLNWKPLVKKCGQGLQFSEEVMTCVSI